METGYRFHAKAEWVSDIRGRVEADPQAPRLDFAPPPEFHGVPGVWSPEHFFMAAVTTCLIATFRAIAEFSKFSFTGLTVTGEGLVEKGEGGYKFTRITLRPVLKVEREEDAERGRRLLEKAERSCLISRSIQSQIELQPTVEVSPVAARP
jgi:peroxiredoxin-like protein